MKQIRVNRIPMPNEKQLAVLPNEARTILHYFEDKIDPVSYKHLAIEFVSKATGKPNMKGPVIRYDNPELMQKAVLGAGVGEYNPDRIPISTYEKMRLDPQIALGTALIEQPILAQNFRIECQNEVQAAFVDIAIRPIYRNLIRDMLRAIQFGFAVGEKTWEQTRLKIIKETETGSTRVIYNKYAVLPKKIKFAHPKSVRIIRDEKTEEIAAVTQTQEYFGNKRVPKVKIEDAIWFALDDVYGNFFGSARYKNSYQAWYWYQIVIQFMLRYLERRGAPAAVGRAPFGSTNTSDGERVSNIDIMLQAANALISNSAVAIPSQFDKNGNQLWDLNLVEDKQRGDLFLDVLRYLNMLKLRGLFVPDKVAVAEGASTNATTEGHTDVHLLNVEALIQMLEDCLNKQLIPDIINNNFPPSKRVPCYIKIERLNYSKRTLLKDVLLRMLMVYSGSMRDGQWPNWLPSVKEISKFLEIPGSESLKQFLPFDLDNDNNDSSSVEDEEDDTEDEVEEDTPSDKEDKINQNNRNAPERREVSRRERRSRERA